MVVNWSVLYCAPATSVPVPMLVPIPEKVVLSPKLSVTELSLPRAHPWVTTKRTVRGAATGSGMVQVIVPKRKCDASATFESSITLNATRSGISLARRNNIEF